MAGSLTQQLVETNLRLTEQLVKLATAIIEAGIKPPVVSEVAIPQLPSFEEFAGGPVSDEERLFLTEEEEDKEYADALSGDTSSNPQLTKQILEAAGHLDLAAQVTAT